MSFISFKIKAQQRQKNNKIATMEALKQEEEIFICHKSSNQFLYIFVIQDFYMRNMNEK